MFIRFVHHSHKCTDVATVLWSCDEVWVRNDGPSSSLSPLYTGPFPVLDRANKFFTLELKGRVSKVSIDRLKVFHPPATLYIEPSPPQVDSDPPLFTSGSHLSHPAIGSDPPPDTVDPSPDISHGGRLLRPNTRRDYATMSRGDIGVLP